MALSKVLAYSQLGQFLMLVMLFSWLYATFAFLSICAVIGPVGNFAQLSIKKLCCKSGPCQVSPKNQEPELVNTNPNIAASQAAVPLREPEVCISEKEKEEEQREDSLNEDDIMESRL